MCLSESESEGETETESEGETEIESVRERGCLCVLDSQINGSI